MVSFPVRVFVAALGFSFFAFFTRAGLAADAPEPGAENPAELIVSLASHTDLALGPIVAVSNRVGQFQKYEATFDLQGDWVCPFDPAQIAADAAFRAPSGKRLTVPCFFYQDYSRSLVADAEVLARVGGPVWKVRFAPVETGAYTWSIVIKNSDKTVFRPGPNFTVSRSESTGFIRRAPQEGYFETDTGAPWFGIGENVCWAGRRRTFDYDRWYQELAAHGANYSRVWTEPFTCFTLEQYNPVRPDAGIGNYLQDDAWRLDYVTGLAEKLGIRQMITLDSYNVLRHDLYAADWQHNAYAKEHGGPIDQPHDYFTNADAMRFYRNRLRYVVARWGYSTSVFCWEFWNEVNGVEQYDPAAVAAWHRDMGDYLAQIDPYHHLKTTSFWVSRGEPVIDSLPELDFVQTQTYDKPDFAALIPTLQNEKGSYHKPHWIGEFGLTDPSKNGVLLPRTGADPHGVTVHNGAWASLMAGCAGTAMTWYWDEFVDPLYLYPIFQPIAAFTAGIGFNRTASGPLRIENLRLASPAEGAALDRVDIRGSSVSWEASPQNAPVNAALGPDGIVHGAGLISGILHGLGVHHDLHNPQTFALNYPAAGAFSVIVTGVSGYGGARLFVTLDGAKVVNENFPDTNAPGQHETLLQFNRAYVVPVPAGQHSIVVSSEGPDWIMVSYSARSAFVRRAPDVAVTGRQIGNSAIVWVRSRTYTWLDRAKGTDAGPQAAGLIDIRGLPDGRYRVHWMDPQSGVWTAETTTRSRGGMLTLTTPPVDTDAAARIEPLR